jgi:hypothetical protein
VKKRCFFFLVGLFFLSGFSGCSSSFVFILL